MIKDGADPSGLAEKLNASTASFRKLHLYGKSIFLSWPDLGPVINDSAIESETVVDGDFVLSSREWKRDNTYVQVDGLEIGKGITIAAGPCSIDFEEGVEEFAKGLKRSGADIIRGGAFKPRTSPFSFQGKGNAGLEIMKRMRESAGLPIVSEILSTENIADFESVDLLQIGSRNAQNFQLLRKVAETGRPVLLKRGMGNTYAEWMATADYVMGENNGSVILCERGIRTFENSTRFTLDLGSIARAKRESHLPICSDPSHAAGSRELVIPLALSSVAAGCDMLLIEVHPDPENALSDGKQQITLEDLKSLTQQIKRLEGAIRG